MTYWLYRTLALLPLPIKYGLSSLAALLLGTVFRYRARIVANNLHNAFPEQNIEWRKAVAQRFYRQFTDVTMEILHSSRMSLDDFAKESR